MDETFCISFAVLLGLGVLLVLLGASLTRLSYMRGYMTGYELGMKVADAWERAAHIIEQSRSAT